jgi:palmitoyltransferase
MQQARRRKVPQSLSLPPYHPDYREEGDAPGASATPVYDSYASSSSDGYDDDPRSGHTHVRRGSEGYEVRPVGREAMLHRYLAEIGETPGRYKRYVPEPDPDESEDDDVPLGMRYNTAQGATTVLR